MPQGILNSFQIAPTGVQPTDFGDLVLWYRGDYQAWNGGGPVADGAPIDLWGERTAGVANAEQPTVGEQPLFQASELNGQDVIEFQSTGGADFKNLRVPNADCPIFDGAGQEDYTIHVVFKPTSFASYQMIATKGFPNSTANIPEFRVNPSGKMELVEDSNFTFAATSAITLNAWNVIAGVRDETNSQLRHYLASVPNGVGARGTSSAEPDFLYIGRRSDGFNILDGFIAEILIYKHAFTDAEVTALAPYWLSRYGL